MRATAAPEDVAQEHCVSLGACGRCGDPSYGYPERMSEYTEADEADLLEQETPILPTDEDPDEEYPNELEIEGDDDEELDDLEVAEPEDPGLSEG